MAERLSWPPDAVRAAKNYLFKTLKKKDFEELYSKGHRVYSKNLTLVHAPGANLAWGLSVSKKVGNSVVRNKLRRRIKEILRKISIKLSTGIHAAFIPKVGLSKLTFTEISDEIVNVLKKAHIVS